MASELDTEGYADSFSSAVMALPKEELIKRSPRGQKVSTLLQVIAGVKDIDNISHHLMALVNKCILASSKNKLPSAAQASLWSTFHRLRCSQAMKVPWDDFIRSNIPSSLQQESTLCFQLILDRMLKAEVRKRVEGQECAAKCCVRPLTLIERNTVRYMAGYVAFKLIKKFTKIAKNSRVQTKRNLFVHVLKGMKADNQPGEPETLLDYTKVWTELVDRGGLYHVKDNVYKLFELIEIVIRKHLNSKAVEAYIPDTGLREPIHKDILESRSILLLWEGLAQKIPLKYEKYTIELLLIVSDLWISIRGYAFAKDWTDKFEKKYKKGTRKELKPVKED